MAENTRPHEAPLKLDLAKLARQKRQPSTKPMSSDRMYNAGMLEETGRTQLISPPPEETLVFRRTSRSTPGSSTSKRKRNAPQPPAEPLQPIEATPNPKPRKQTRRQSTPIDSPTRPQSTPSRPSRSLLSALNPDADFLPPLPPSTLRTARVRRTTPIPPYEPPTDVFTPPREVMMTPTISKSSKRKTGSRPKPKSAAKPLRVVLPIKKELPDIDLSLPMPPPSPTDDPLLLSGPLMPPTSTPTRAPRQLKHVGIITSASLVLSPVLEPEPALPDTLPPSSEPDPLPSSGVEPPIYFNWDAAPSSLPPTSDDDDSMDLDPADADVPAPAPLFPPSVWNDMDAGGWSDSDDDDDNAAPEVGEGEYTGRYHTLSVRTKLDPPSSATRTRMEDWGRPITPFPRKIAKLDFLAAVDERGDGPELAQDAGPTQSQEQAPDVDAGPSPDMDTQQIQDGDIEMVGEEAFDEAEEREVREMSVPRDADADDSGMAEAGAEDEQTPLHALNFDVSFDDADEPSHEEALSEEPSYEEEPSYDQGLLRAKEIRAEDVSLEEEGAQAASMEENAPNASVDENDASFEIPLPPRRTTPNARAATPADEHEEEEADDHKTNASEHQDADVSIDIEADHYDGDAESHASNSDSDEEEEAEEREVRDMSVSFDEGEEQEEPISFITFSPTTPGPAPVFSPPPAPSQSTPFTPAHAPVFSPPPPDTNADTEDEDEDAQMRDEHGDLLGTATSKQQASWTEYEAGPRSAFAIEATADIDAEADSDASSSDTEVDAGVVRITSADPRAAAHAAAILKQHDYDCYTKLTRHPKDTRRKTVVGGGVHKPKTPATGKQRRVTLGMGLLGDRVYIPGSPAITLPELLQQAEAQVAPRIPFRSAFGTPLSGPKAGFGTPLYTTPLPRRHSSAAVVLQTGADTEWTKEEWKLLDACFTDERLEHGLNGALAPVDSIHIDDVVVRFLALFSTSPWDRPSIQQRVKALQNKQRAGHVAPPTTPYTPSPAATGMFGASRRVPSMEVPDFTPLGRRALPPRKQRPAPTLVADANTNTNAPFANLPVEETEEELPRTTARKMHASLLAPRYSHLLEEAVAVSLQPTSVADASVVGVEDEETVAEGDSEVAEGDATVEDASFEADLSLTTLDPAPAPQSTPTTLGTRVKGFLFSYLPRSKSAPKPKPNSKPPSQRGLPLPPPAILSKPRGPINTPVRAPAPKPTHPRDLVHLQPAPAPPPATKIPRAKRPQRLVELHPAPAPVPVLVVVPRPRRSSGGSVKDLVRNFEELDGQGRAAELKRVRSVGEWRKGLGGKTSDKPGWKP